MGRGTPHASAHEPGSTYDAHAYVGGTGDVRALCATRMVPSVGGACFTNGADFVLRPRVFVRVVEHESWNPVGFEVQFRDAAGEILEMHAGCGTFPVQEFDALSPMTCAVAKGPASLGGPAVRGVVTLHTW